MSYGESIADGEHRIVVNNQTLYASARITTRAQFEQWTSALFYVAEQLWPEPVVEPVKKPKKSTAGWTPERRAEQAERMRQRNAGGKLNRKGQRRSAA